jgi:hypothetical protein
VNVTNKPVELSNNGTQKASTLKVLDWSPNAPSNIAWKESAGAAPKAINSNEVSSKAARIGTIGHAIRNHCLAFKPALR